MNDARITAAFDQINAAHRDAMEAYRRFREVFRGMDIGEKRVAVSEMPALHLEVLAAMAEEDGDIWISLLLKELGNA